MRLTMLMFDATLTIVLRGFAKQYNTLILASRLTTTQLSTVAPKFTVPRYYGRHDNQIAVKIQGIRRWHRVVGELTSRLTDL